MTFWGGISRWASSLSVRRHAPVAGSIAIHAAAGAVLMAALAMNGGSPEVQRSGRPREAILEVALISVPGASDPAHFPKPAPLPGAGTSPSAAKRAAKDRQPAAPVEAQGSDGAESVFPGAQADGLARGLASLGGSDPCRAKHGPKLRTCDADWAGKGGQAPLLPATNQEQARYYAEYMPKCPWNVGCETKAWISTNGTRSVGGPAPGSRNDHGSSTPMAAGAAGLGGLHDSVGRLGFNPDHFDRGFGD